MEDASVAYNALCGEHSVKASSEVLRLLKGRICGRITSLDLRQAYLSRVMVPVLADLVMLLSSLQALNLSRAQLCNEGVERLCKSLVDHPAVQSVDLSHNGISLTAGKQLLGLACNNTNVVEIGLEGTDISETYRNRIQMQLQLNRGRDIQKKEMTHQTGDEDAGIGLGAVHLRRLLGFGPPGGVEDEEWEVHSNLEDNHSEALLREEEVKVLEEERVRAATPGVAELVEDIPVELPVFEPSAIPRGAPAGGGGGVGQEEPIQRSPLRPQDLAAISRSIFNLPPEDDSPRLWTDDTFLPTASSLITSGTANARMRRTKDIFWVRASVATEQRKSPRLFVDVQKPSCPIPGRFTDNWLCITLQLFRRYPQMLRNLFIRTLPDIGAYQVQVFKSGVWMQVVIDDFLPCDSEGNFVGITLSDPNELWAPLIEKAFAKLYGGYDRLARGSTTSALSDLSGGISHNIYLRNHTRAREVATDGTYWGTMRGYFQDGCILAAAVKTSSDTERASIAESDITVNRLYEVIQMVETPKWKLVQLCPTFDEPATRPTALDPVWLDDAWMSKLQEADYRLMYPHLSEPQDVPQERRRWITFEHYCIFFNKLYICRAESIVTSGISPSNIQRLTGGWLGKSAGGKLRCQYFTENPCYNVRVSDKDSLVHIRLSQPDFRLLRKECEHALGLYVVKSSDATRKKRNWSASDVVSIPTFHRVRDVHVEILCQPNTNYFIIPCTRAPGVEARFQLTFASPHPYFVDEVVDKHETELLNSGSWAGFTAGGRTSGFPTWCNNPQFRLRVLDGTANVAVVLHQVLKAQTLPHYASYSIYASDGGRVGPHNPGQLLHAPDFAPYATVFSEVELKEGYYTIVAMTWNKGDEGAFQLSVITSARCVLSPLMSLLNAKGGA